MNIKQFYAAEPPYIGNVIDPTTGRIGPKRKRKKSKGGGGYWITPFTERENGGNGTYYNSLCQSPINNNIIKLISTATAALRIRTSVDKGDTWGAFSNFITGAVGDTFGVSAGYAANGRLHVLYVQLEADADRFLKYVYSDNNGTNWSAPSDISAIIEDLTNPLYIPHGPMIENAGVMMCNFYRVDHPEGGGLSSSEVLTLRLVAGTWEVVVVTDDFYVNESTMVSLGGNNLLIISRAEAAPYNYRQYFSSDNGATWVKHGIVEFQLPAVTEAKAPLLKKFVDVPGTDEIIVLYFPRLCAVDRKLFACYARPQDLISYGVLGWNMNNVKEILNYPEESVMYGDVCHYNNDYKAFGTYLLYDDALHNTELLSFDIADTDHATRNALWDVYTITTVDSELLTLFNTNIADVALWVDYRDKVNMNINYSTNIVSTWRSRLNKGNDFITGAALLKATGMSFNGINQQLKTAAIASLVQPLFVYIVFKMEEWDAVNYQWFIDGLTATQCLLYQAPTDVSPEIKAYCLGFTGKSNELAVNTYGIVRFAANGLGAGSYIRVNNGAEKADVGGVGNLGGMVLGSAVTNEHWALMEVKEVIALNYVPDAAEQAYTMTRLAAKNGITLV